MIYLPHEFSGEIAHYDLGTYRYTVVFLPPDIAAALPLAEHPRLRISGELNDAPMSGAWQPSRGRWYLMLSKPLLRAAGVAVGDRADVRFRLEDQDAVDTPALLERALDADSRAKTRWDELTPGKQRGLAQRVASPKSSATAARRLGEVIDFLHAGEIDLRKLGKVATR